MKTKKRIKRLHEEKHIYFFWLRESFVHAFFAH
jgi:hypothetical protein